MEEIIDKLKKTSYITDDMVNYAIECIDGLFGDGTAQAHPELVFKYIDSTIKIHDIIHK